MKDSVLIKKMKDKIAKDERRFQISLREVERIWEVTGLDPKDPSYLVEKTMRFEMAQSKISNILLLFGELIDNYKTLCTELEKIPDSE